MKNAKNPIHASHKPNFLNQERKQEINRYAVSSKHQRSQDGLTNIQGLLVLGLLCSTHNVLKQSLSNHHVVENPQISRANPK